MDLERELVHLNAARFDLQCFCQPTLPVGGIRGSVSREGDVLSITYQIPGSVENIRWPYYPNPPGRGGELWRTTCFEAFIWPTQGENYWELNLSPSGHWQFYRFVGYRSGCLPEESVKEVSVQRFEEANFWSLSVSVSLDFPLVSGLAWQLGISAIIESKSGGMNYWALCHLGDKPDFHRRETFLVSL